MNLSKRPTKKLIGILISSQGPYHLSPSKEQRWNYCKRRREGAHFLEGVHRENMARKAHVEQIWGSAGEKEGVAGLGRERVRSPGQVEQESDKREWNLSKAFIEGAAGGARQGVELGSLSLFLPCSCGRYYLTRLLWVSRRWAAPRTRPFPQLCREGGGKGGCLALAGMSPGPSPRRPLGEFPRWPFDAATPEQRNLANGEFHERGLYRRGAVFDVSIPGQLVTANNATHLHSKLADSLQIESLVRLVHRLDKTTQRCVHFSILLFIAHFFILQDRLDKRTFLPLSGISSPLL
jgi:hypothetical protein